MKKPMTFSARLNDDGSWPGMGWDKDRSVLHPLIIVGINQEYYWTRKEAIRAAKAKASTK